MKAKTTKNAGKSLVVLGVKRNPYIYNDTVHMTVVEGDPATLVRQLRKTTQRNVRVYAQAPVKNTKPVNRFLRHTRSAKGAASAGTSTAWSTRTSQRRSCSCVASVRLV